MALDVAWRPCMAMAAQDMLCWCVPLGSGHAWWKTCQRHLWLHKVEIMIFFHKTFSMSLLIWMKINLKINTKMFWPTSDEWVKSYSIFASTLCTFCYQLFPFMAITNWLHKNIFCSNFTFFDGKPPHQGVSKRLASTETLITFFSINWFPLKPSFQPCAATFLFTCTLITT